MVRIWVPGEMEPIDIDQAVIRWASSGEVGMQVVALSNGADFQLGRYVERALAQAPMGEVVLYAGGIFPQW